MTNHKQFNLPEPCAPGLCEELCCEIYGLIPHDSCHADGFVLSTNRFFYESMARMTSLTYILLVYFITNVSFVFSLNPKGEQKSSWFAILQPDLNSGTLAWWVRRRHMHRRIIMSRNLVTKTQKKLTESKIGRQIAFHRDMTSKMSICVSIPPLAEEPSPCLRPNPICLCWFPEEVKCSGKSIWAQQATFWA